MLRTNGSNAVCRGLQSLLRSAGAAYVYRGQLLSAKGLLGYLEVWWGLLMSAGVCWGLLRSGRAA